MAKKPTVTLIEKPIKRLEITAPDDIEEIVVNGQVVWAQWDEEECELRVCHGCQNIIREDEVCLVLKSDRSQDDTESVKNLYFCKKCGRTLKRLAVRL